MLEENSPMVKRECSSLMSNIPDSLYPQRVRFECISSSQKNKKSKIVKTMLPNNPIMIGLYEQEKEKT